MSTGARTRTPLIALMTLLTLGVARAEAPAAGPYAPYAFLAGEWAVRGADGGEFGVARFIWGPGRSYLWYSVSLLEEGKEQPHMEGMLMWNAVHKNLDMLMALDLEGGIDRHVIPTRALLGTTDNRFTLKTKPITAAEYQAALQLAQAGN